MIHRRSTFFLGIFILIIPFLGLPSSWKTTLVLLSGVALVVLSVKIILPKKNIKPRMKREKSTPVFVESMPVSRINSKTEMESKIDVPLPDTE